MQDWKLSLGMFAQHKEVIHKTEAKRYQAAKAHAKCAVHDAECSGDVVWNAVYQLPLCWQHDNHCDTSRKVALAALKWGKDFVLEESAKMAGTKEEQVTAAHVGWWALAHGLAEHLPDAVMTAATGVRNAAEYERTAHGDRMTIDATRESRIELLRRKIGEQKPKLKLTADDECWNLYQARPKAKRWENRKYLNAVKTLPCVVCDSPSDDPHHLIGHGQGKMGSTAHDFFAIPLCRQHHNELHADMHSWERRHGSQLQHVLDTQDALFGLGVVE